MTDDAPRNAVKRQRVLVIDDEELARETLTSVLEDAGYEVLSAADGEAGLALFERDGADVVVTDIIMPKKEGIETIFDLRARSPDLCIIAISGGGRIASDRFLAIARKFGADHVLSKPFRNDALIAVVRRCLSEPRRSDGAGSALARTSRYIEP